MKSFKANIKIFAAKYYSYVFLSLSAGQMNFVYIIYFPLDYLNIGYTD